MVRQIVTQSDNARTRIVRACGFVPARQVVFAVARMVQNPGRAQDRRGGKGPENQQRRKGRIHARNLRQMSPNVNAPLMPDLPTLIFSVRPEVPREAWRNPPHHRKDILLAVQPAE
jgi:hypothetical protein